jgi:4-hydroxybenzoate polyprenyltransferase
MNSKSSCSEEIESNSLIPLVIDLDGTLVRTDMLWETLFLFLRKFPLSFLLPLYWLLRGKAFLKHKLASKTEIDIEKLPYESRVIEIIERERNKGRYIVLATATNITIARKIAQHLGLFDSVVATESNVNFASYTKRNFLVSNYGVKGFDYAGNSRDDLCVWDVSRLSYLVNVSPNVRRKALLIGNTVEIIQTINFNIRKWFKALRIHQWSKNTLVFIPLFASHNITNWFMTSRSLIAFIVFSFTASSVYVLNDLLDLPDDRHHQTKRYRPFANGTLSIQTGLMIVPLLLAVAFGISLLTLPILFTVGLLAYYLITLAYSVWLKRHIVIDVIALAILYTLRIIEGAAAINVESSFWILALSMFIFLSLAMVKRYAEILLSCDSKGNVGGRGYVSNDLSMIASLGASSGYVSVLVLALYIHDEHTLTLYSHPYYIWMACPLILFWVSRVWMLVHRGEMHQDPIVFALRDKISLGTIFLIMLSFWAAI